jgi:CRISPR-associated protein (TIGR03986 family)
MQTASLSKRNNQWYLKYRKGNSPKIKEIAVGDEFNLDDAWDGKEVEISFTAAGVLETIKMAGKEIEKQGEEKPVLETRPVQREALNIPLGYKLATLKKSQGGVNLLIDDEETRWVPRNALSDFDLIGDGEVFVKTSGPRFVESILSEGDEIIKPRENTRQRDGQGGQQRRGQQAGATNQHRDVAHAPYNFVPINELIVDSDLYSTEKGFDLEKIRFDMRHADLHSGYIELTIEALTKIFIGSGEKDEQGRYKFFAPDGTPRIPGASLRGMVRTLVEVCSWGEFKFFEDKQLFYRTFQTSSMDKEFYRDRMVKKHGQPKAKAGYLCKEGRDFFIRPALSTPALCKTSYYRVNYEKDRNHANYKHVKTIGFVDEFERKKVFFNPAAVSLHRNHSIPLEYADIGQVFDTNNGSCVEGWLIASGHIYNKKHIHWVINLPDISSKIPVDKDVINTYKSDSNRKIPEVFQLDNNLKKDGVPCFYLEETGKITAIGHTPYFRLPYQKKIGDLLPEVHKNYKGIDIPTVIFGNEQGDDKDKATAIAGRVYFEDAICRTINPVAAAVTHRGQDTAISPKPTSFQLYLKQDNTNVRKEDLKHYDSENAALRGNKMYWHHRVGDNIRPLLQFNPAKIAFTNLSKVELGALLFVLDLPQGCHHKIGMGKPLGLGSIKISPKLYIDKHDEKYASFTKALDYKAQAHEKTDFVNAFTKYLKGKIELKESDNLWEVERLKELRALLEKKPLNKDYMPFKVNGRFNPKFAQREILPKASEIK